ncbi:MAG TPA: hypothetical protein VKA67_01740 [Verrucomicrobiae bacterium]|nr:hypothetical protein [Verrucomicrobiae bacterium]
MLTKSKFITVLLGVVALVIVGVGVASADDLSAADKAQIAQFDKGPRTIDVSSYPEKLQDYYQVFSRKCSQCHKLSRPINSNFVLPEQWSRYIKRMMYKPGSNIGRSDAKKIYDFLVYDSSVRKKKQLEAALKGLKADERAAQEKKIKEVVDKYK